VARRPRLRAVWAVRAGSIKAVPLKRLLLPLSRRVVVWGLDILAQEVATRKLVIKARSIRVGNVFACRIFAYTHIRVTLWVINSNCLIRLQT
jgi:hypothetical protein